MPEINIEKLEKFAWENGIRKNDGKNHKLFKLDKTIGAYEGEETKCMIVKMSANEIHGHPISLAKYIQYTK